MYKPCFCAGAVVLLLLVINGGVVRCEQSVITNEVGVTSGKSQTQHQLQQSSFVPSSASSPPSGGVSSGAPVVNGGNVEEQYRATYFYPLPHHQVNWNRDSYADAANEFGYNQQQTHQPSASVPGAVYAPAYGGDTSAEGYGDESFGGGGALGGIGGLGGLAGILGIKGIKGLGILGVAKAAIPLLAILLPGLLILPLLFLFFPVPVITVPAQRRSLMGGLNFGEISGKMSSLARSVLESDKCMERISCEMSRVSRGSFIERTLKRVIPRFEPHMPQALKRIARVYLEGPPTCSKKYTCYLMDDTGSSSSNKANQLAN